MSYISSLDGLEVEALREHMLGNFEDFSKFCFKIMTGQRLMHVDYYVVLFESIQKLIDAFSIYLPATVQLGQKPKWAVDPYRI